MLKLNSYIGEKMSILKVKKYFEKFDIENRVLEFDVSSATVELASKALNCEPARIAKSLSFMIAGVPTVIVFAGTTKVSNSKFKHHFGAKAKMLTFDEVESLVGHKVGGVCPFAINDGVEVYLDLSLKAHQTIFPACGSSNSAIELTPLELEKYSSNFKGWIDVGQE